MITQDFQEVAQHYLSLFHQKDYYFNDDNKRIAYFKKNSLNEDVKEIVVKISTMEHEQIDDSMASRRFMADHIASLHIDHALQEGQPEVVEAIAHLDIRGKSHFLYSFASRYCNWHNMAAYPIYDPAVHKLLNFYKQQLTGTDLADDDVYRYSRFKEQMIAFRQYLQMDNYNFKEVDKFIWIYGNTIIRDLTQKQLAYR